MASTFDKPITSPSKAGQSTDPERGRKRRRSSANLPPASQSTNLRGRARRRSVSPSTTLSTLEKKSLIRSSKSPNRKFQKKSTKLEQERKRSQSPSRSRCAGDKAKESPPRRRQRTTSRSRKHGDNRGNQDPEQNDNADYDGNELLKEDNADEIAVEE